MDETAFDELLERLACIEDERAIVATLYRYGSALDDGDEAAFLDCFTPTARYEVVLRLRPGSDVTHVGHDELMAFFRNHTHAPDAFHKHVTVNPSVTIDGSSADVRSYFLRVDSPAEGPAIVLASGRYVDRFERDATGRWRIASRRCEVENR